MKSIKNFLIPFDIFGITYAFRYKDKEKYQTSLGGLVVIFFMILVIIAGIYYFIPFVNRKNYTIVYYTMNLAITEEVNLFESESNFAIGLNCESNKKEHLSVYEILDLKSTYILYEKHRNGTYEKHITNLASHKCNYDDFYNKYNKQVDYLGLSKFECLDKREGTLQGIYADQIFSYFEFTVAAKNDSILKEVDRFLFENDCKLKIVYTEVIIDLDNYKEPITQYLNDVFIQLNPTLFMKRNMYFMNQYFTNDDYLLFVIGDEKPELKALYSRYEEYSLYLGLNRISTQTSNYDKYAKLYLRSDLKRTIIIRRYQKFMEFFADASSLLIALYDILFIIFSFVDNFYAFHSLSTHLFFFKGIEGKNNFNIFKQRKQINELISNIDKEEQIIDINSNEVNNKKSKFILNKNKDGKEIEVKEDLHSDNSIKGIQIYKNIPFENEKIESLKINKEIEKKVNAKNLKKIKILQLNKKYNHNQNIDDIGSEDYLQKKMVSEIKNNMPKYDILNIYKANADMNYKDNIDNNIMKLSSPLSTSKEEKKKNAPKIINSFNIIEIIITNFFKCFMCHNIKIKNSINENANEIIYQKLDIISYIRNMILFDIMNQNLFDDKKDLINLLCRPIISVKGNQKNEFNEFYKCYKERDFEKLSNVIKELQLKPDKTEREQKLLFLSKEHLKKFV